MASANTLPILGAFVRRRVDYFSYTRFPDSLLIIFMLSYWWSSKYQSWIMTNVVTWNSSSLSVAGPFARARCKGVMISSMAFTSLSPWYLSSQEKLLSNGIETRKSAETSTLDECVQQQKHQCQRIIHSCQANTCHDPTARK